MEDLPTRLNVSPQDDGDGFGDETCLKPLDEWREINA